MQRTLYVQLYLDEHTQRVEKSSLLHGILYMYTSQLGPTYHTI